MKNYSFTQIQELLNSANHVLIALPKGVTFDQIAAGLSLSLCLQKTGKQVSVVCPDPMRVEFSRLVGVDKVTDKPSGSDLAISFNYPLDGIEKVTSNDDGGKLNLVVKLKPGQTPINPAQINFSPAGANADLIFTIGLHKFEGLGKIYFDNRQIFEQKPIINIDNTSVNAGYGKVNIVDTESFTITEMISTLISGMQLPADSDIATNLLLGLETTTDSFKNLKMTADTFEAVAYAIRNGGRRMGMTINEAVNSEPAPVAETPAETPAPATTDWMEPKIYKGSQLP